MQNKKMVNKLGKVIRKNTGNSFIDSIRIAKLYLTGADQDFNYISIKGLRDKYKIEHKDWYDCKNKYHSDYKVSRELRVQGVIDEYWEIPKEYEEMKKRYQNRGGF